MFVPGCDSSVEYAMTNSLNASKILDFPVHFELSISRSNVSKIIGA